MEKFEDTIEADGKTVKVNVISNDAGGWLLEVVDEFWNSTTWDEPFESAEAAFEEAAKAVEEEGIDAFIGAGKNVKH